MTDHPQESPAIDLGEVAGESPEESTEEQRRITGEDTGEGGTVDPDDAQ